MTPGSVAVCSRDSAERTMARCSSGSFGRPAVWPRGKFTKLARGGFTLAVMTQDEVNETVGIPSASRWRAISPTD